ncbi:MAG: NUDIX domain-containing protein [Anaerolineae bacterium]|nr:NUDIX domain-containing protein [Anaerolineae bacterium]
MSDSGEELSLTVEEAASLRQGFTYCPRCRAEMVNRELYGRVRRVCSDAECRFVQFIDPKVTAAVMAEKDGRILMVRRTMEPERGKWCFPGGFMEIGETPQQTAIRECREESGYEVEISRLIDAFYYEDYRGSGVLIMYKGKVVGGQPATGDDTDQVDFFGLDDLPDIAFDTNRQAIALWREGKLSDD